MINPIKDKLQNGQTVLGIWSIIPSPIVSEIIGLAGFDFQILDMEHGVYDLNSLDAGIRACEATGCSPIVRVPGIIPNLVQSVMDLGSHGVIFPQITDKETALLAIQCMKFSPNGTRGYNPFTRAANYSNPVSNENGKLNNEFGLASVIIENVKSYNSLDNILDIPDLDVVYLGVYDMAVALGCKGNVNDPQIISFVESSITKIHNAGKSVGIMVKNKNEIKRAVELGVNVMVYAVDSFLIHRAANEAVALFKEGLS